jgi:type I restriction enzyme S subunit
MRMGGVKLAAIRYVPEDVAPSIRAYRIFKDDIFISVAGTLGIVGRIPSQLDGANLTENADRITAISCDVDYLMYSLLSESIQREIGAIQTVGAQPKLALGRIKQFEIQLPTDVAEQRRIAAALKDHDAIISTLELLIAKKQSVKQGMMQSLLTGRIRLPGFEGNWESRAVAASSVMKARIGWQGLKTDEYRSTGEFYLVGGTDFSDGRINWDTTPFVDRWRFDQDPNIQLQVGDVLLTKDGSIGKTAYVDSLPGPATLNSGVFVIRPVRKAYDSRFFYLMLRSRAFADFLTRLTAGSTISHLYQRDLVTLELLMPPTVAEQEAIAEVLLDSEDEVKALRSRLSKARAVKQGMMQELLTGRTRLPASDGVAA